MEPGEYSVEIDGVTQAFEVRGKGPVCLVHSGGPGIHSDYLRMPLLEERLTMLYVDPVGTRHSGLLPDGDYRVERYAHFTRRLIAHFGLHRPYFLGHSHGGFVGLQLALETPEVLGGMVIYDSAPVYGPELFEEAGRQVNASVARWPGRPEIEHAGHTFWEYKRPDGPAITDRESFLGYLKGVLPLYFADYRRTVGEAGILPIDVTFDPARQPSRWDVRGKLGKISLPALVIAGAFDFICPPRWARDLHRELPASRLRILDGSGHFGHIEQPYDFADAVLTMTC
ncbi:alpha/beta fold hydrolase [Lentzea sp. NPDC051213]|uniref:alpha/beta fold hydrolase n=1 Tax=Lentzea sp. NPDC051213 TaxID=3364126 RepID=UPI0037A2196B